MSRALLRSLLFAALGCALTAGIWAQSTISDSRGRYVVRLPEGPHIVKLSAPGHTSAWRQVIVPAGGMVVPIDVRLEESGERRAASDGEDLTLTHGGATKITRPVTLTIPAGSLTPGTNVTLTSISAQSLAGLLPYGWSPIASAEIVMEDATISGAEARGERREASGAAISGAEARGERREASGTATIDANYGAGGRAMSSDVTSLSSRAWAGGGEGRGTSGVPNDVSRTAPARTSTEANSLSERANVSPLPAGMSTEAASVNPGRGVRGLSRQSVATADEGLPVAAHAAASLSSATLSFTVPYDEIIATTQTLTAVVYDETRDEWMVISPTVNVTTDGKASVSLANLDDHTAIALVYPDKGTDLITPAAPITGAPLQGVAPVTADFSDTTTTLTLDPPIILPTGRTVATLTIDDSSLAAHRSPLPSGTAVQAWIDEELRLADGSVVTDPPFATDLILYRTLDGSMLVAEFHLAPSERAAEVVLEVGYEHVRVQPYPERLERGVLIGPEGGRVPGDGGVVIEIPSAATNEPLHTQSRTLDPTELSTFGTLEGFLILGGFELQMQRLETSEAEELEDQPSPVELLAPARAIVQGPGAGDQGSEQLIIAEVLDASPYGRVFRLVSRLSPLASDPSRWTTLREDPSILPLTGITREGRYLILQATQPIAYAFGFLRNTSGGYLENALLKSLAPGLEPPAPLGVSGLTPVTGLFVVPVVSQPEPPFVLVPRTQVTGDGAPYTHPTAPLPEAIVNVGDLTLTPQPPVLVSTSPENGATEVSLTPSIRATFSPGIDPSSITSNSLILTNTLTGDRVPGTVSTDGIAINWTIDPLVSRFSPLASYTATLSPSIRGTNGSLFGQSHTFSFRTITQLTNAEVDPTKIRITIPDANGVSRIIGDAGALPSGWQAVAIRRGVDFVTRYQSTAASDGSFSFFAGACGPGPCSDRVTIHDTIDLQAINTAGNVAAIIRLTPFVSEDRRAFIASPASETRFTSIDGITVIVPAGAFDQPTKIDVSPSAKDAFARVPEFDDELRFATAMRLDFDCTVGGTSAEPCVARQRLQVELPVPSELDTTGTWLLGHLGDSIRGPRVMIVDTLRVDGAVFTSQPETSALSAGAFSPLPAGMLATSGGGSPGRGAGGEGLQISETITATDVKSYLLGVIRSGIYSVVDVRIPDGGALGWGILDNIQSGYDLFWDLKSLYAAHWYFLERGRKAIPVITGQPFTIVGVDARTGLQAFQKVYDPLPPGDPGAAFVIDTPDEDVLGPYPVFATPFRVEIVDLEVENEPIDVVRHFSMTLSNGKVSLVDSDDPLPATTSITLMNASTGATDSTRANGLDVDAKVGDRILLLMGSDPASPDTALSLVFSEPIWTGAGTSNDEVGAYLKSVVTFERAADPEAAVPTWIDLTDQTTMRTDSQDRRIMIDLPSSLYRGGIYRVSLAPGIADRSGPGGSAGLRIGERKEEGTVVGGLTDPIRLMMRVRAPKGELTSFDLASGSVRDMALDGNLLFLSALDGGVYAYDTADPASLSGASVPRGRIEAGENDYWAILSDPHGRVWTTGFTPLFGFIRSWELRDFLGAPGSGVSSVVTEPRSGAIVSWRPGVSTQSSLATDTLLSDRPEATPRKMQIVLQDESLEFSASELVASFDGSSGALTDEFRRASVEIAMSPDYPFATQRISVVNVTRDMRWSADATAGERAKIENILIRSDDRMRVVWNLRTFAVVSLFGHGVAIWDLTAVEANDSGAGAAVAEKPLEQILLTRADIESACSPLVSAGEIIPDLTFSPEAAILAKSDGAALTVFGIESRRGIIDFTVTPDDEGLIATNCTPRSVGLRLLESPRLQALADAFELLSGGRRPVARFTGVASYHWMLEAENNAAVAVLPPPQQAPGQRGSIAGQRVARDYLLIPAFEYGLLVVEAGGKNLPALSTSPFANLNHLVDVIWIPGGAWGVRHIPRTDLAVVVDGEGRVLLVDLSRIDERFGSNGAYIGSDPLFATAARSLLVNGGYGVGTEDPRIIWRSEPGLAGGTLAPVVDPDTGILYTGKPGEKTVKVASAIDPRVQIKADIGSADGLAEIGGVVPLGIDSPANILQCNLENDPNCNASLGAFRLELTLPGGISEALAGGQLRIAVESETVAGAAAAQTPEPLPRSHLRQTRRDGSPESRAATSFVFRREIPEAMAAELRHQKGFNRWTSPWIVAVADPRASLEWEWGSATPQQRRAEGCESCIRPAQLQGRTETEGVFEIWSAGRVFVVRPELIAGAASDGSVFDGTPYGWLGEEGRLVARFGTVIADTVRPTDVRVAAQHSPVADGMLQGTIFVHSGELQESAVDLDAGGRAGWNVVVDRTYRSRTIGGSPLGLGWESRIFQRLRPLPNGDVEYRDGIGEIWRFGGQGAYISPNGLFLKLIRSDRGWNLIDQQWRITSFDELGRLVAESDEFVDAQKPGSGNTIHYLYDASGRLARIIDPVGRATKVEYWTDADAGTSGAMPGRLRRITDWRDREVAFAYDAHGRLTQAALPEVAAASGMPAEYTHVGAGRPRAHYEYESETFSAFKDKFELAANLKAITNPNEIGSGDPRVEYTFDTSSSPSRDHVTAERWPCGDHVFNCAPLEASFAWTANTASVTDVLGQERSYLIETAADGYRHISLRKDKQVPTLAFDPQSLPDQATTDLAAEPVDMTTTFTQISPSGIPQSISLASGSSLAFELDDAAGGAVGAVVKGITVAAALVSPVHTAIIYGTSALGVNLPELISRGDVSREVSTPHRENLKIERKDEDLVQTTEYTEHGLIQLSKSASPSGETALEHRIIHYAASYPSLVSRGQIAKSLRGGSQERTLSFKYETVPGGGIEQVVTDENLGSTSVTRLDSLDRPVKRIVTGAQGEILLHERFAYDATGNLVFSTRQQSDLGVVEEHYRYDRLGRLLETRTTGAVVDGQPAEIRTETLYDLSEKTIVEILPFAGADASAAPQRTTKLDPMGRPTTVIEHAPGSSDQIVQRTAYDLHGGVSYVTDGVRTAQIFIRDGLGRVTDALLSDGTSSNTTYNDWNEPQTMISYDADGNASSQVNQIYTSKGRLRAANDQLDPPLPDVTTDRVRQTRYHWDQGNRVQGVRVGIVDSMTDTFIASEQPVRLSETIIDDAGRPSIQRSGEAAGSAGGLTKTFAHSEVVSYYGDQPSSVRSSEPITGATYLSSFEYDALGRAVRQIEPGGYESSTSYDEAGNVIAHRPAGLGQVQSRYDSRGLVTETVAADGSITRFRYDALGNLVEYEDQAGEITRFTTDQLGRVVRIDYPDLTFEEVRYENLTGQVLASQDRAGQWLSFTYDSGGRLLEVHDGPDPATSTVLTRYRYDVAGRVEQVTNADAAIRYGQYDFAGRPRLLTVVRFDDGTGLAPDPQTRDELTQQIRWNEFDEVSRYSLPIRGSLGPTGPIGNGWRTWIDQQYDGGGNLVRQREAGGATGEATREIIAQSFGRGAGRLMARTRLPGSAAIATQYDFADGEIAPIPSVELPSADVFSTSEASGLLRRARTTRASFDLAGSWNARDPSRRVGATLDLGLGERASLWDYDARGRMESQTLLAMLENFDQAPATIEALTPWDFRQGRERPIPFSPSQIAFLGADLSSLLPASWTAGEDPGHQIGGMTRAIGSQTEVAAFAFEGGRRTSDGVWRSIWDRFGRLIATESEELGRRVEYLYDPLDRVIGRIAYQRAEGGGWDLETRTNVLARDGLPADTTFVWDISDRLVAIFESGAQAGAAGGLLRQFIHGDQGYDDPVEVIVAGSSSAPAESYYPIVDEAGTGSVHAVVDRSGYLVERVLYADSYGDAPRYLHGAVLDKLEISASKNEEGDLAEVVIRAHVSEALDAEVVAEALRVRALEADGSELATAPGAPELDGGDANTVIWTIPGQAWDELTAGAFSIEIAATAKMRATAWGSVPVMEAPEWAKILFGVESSPATPIVRRESTTFLAELFDSIPASDDKSLTVYSVPDLYLAAGEDSKTGLFTGFKAAPFVEPATGLVYLRARWYDPTTGSFLTPDPSGYLDSSNLYAGFAGDPVNLSDPTGEFVGFVIDAAFAVYDTWSFASGRIGADEYALRMALTGASVVANAATGGLGGGLAVRAATLPGRAGRVVRGGMHAAVALNRSEIVYNVAQAGFSAKDALADQSYGRAGISGAQIGLGVLGLRGPRGSRWSTIHTPWGREVNIKRFDSDLDWDLVRPPGARMAGSTNLEAAAQGYAPIRISPATDRVETLVLHHMNKEPGGVLTTIWSNTHNRRHVGDRLTARGASKTKHDPLLNWRKENPELSVAFDDEKAVFWKWLSWAYKPPIDAIRVPPAIRPRLPD